MNGRWSFVAVVLTVLVVVLYVAPIRAQMKKESRFGTKQVTYVIVESNGTSRMLIGDDLTKQYAESDPNHGSHPIWAESALPNLLRDRWDVTRETPMGGGDETCCLLRMEKTVSNR